MSDLIRKLDQRNKGVEPFQVKLLIIVLAPKWRIILQGYFSIVSDALFQVFTEIKYHSVVHCFIDIVASLGFE